MTTFSSTTPATNSSRALEQNSPTPATRDGRALRWVLRANAATSATTGLVGAVAADYWSRRLGIDHTAITFAVSIGLIIFAAEVLWASTQPTKRLGVSALAVSLADATWVVASVVVVALGLLSSFGVVATLVAAVGVADLAVAQLWLRRRLDLTI